MKNAKNIFGLLIKTYRNRLKISQEALSATLTLLGLNIDQSALSRIENGTRILYDYELYYICKVLNIDIKLFFEDNLISNLPKELNKNISGMYIKSRRILLNISQDFLIKTLNSLGLNIDQPTLSRIENGTRVLYDYELYYICKVIDIDIDSLIEPHLIIKITNFLPYQ